LHAINRLIVFTNYFHFIEIIFEPTLQKSQNLLLLINCFTLSLYLLLLWCQLLNPICDLISHSSKTFPDFFIPLQNLDIVGNRFKKLLSKYFDFFCVYDVFLEQIFGLFHKHQISIFSEILSKWRPEKFQADSIS